MLPQKLKLTAVFTLLILCLSGRIVQAETIKCLQCADVDSCEDAQQTTCADGIDRCYTKVDNENSIVRMGCISDFTNEEEINAEIKSKFLSVCTGDLCNDYPNLAPFYNCVQCNSNDNVQCATRPAAVVTRVQSTNIIYTQCYQRVRIDGSGVTERGALALLSEDEFYNCLSGADVLCKICNNNQCNLENIPADRQQCHRCDSGSDTSCHYTPAALSVCPVYTQNDGCVSVFENGVTKRGCQSEFTCNPSTSKGCETCSNNGCNSANLKKRVEDLYGIFQDLPLNCYTCSGTADCAVAARNPHKCEDDNYQDCLTVFNDDQQVVQRGCESQITAEHQTHCQENPQLCFNCKANGCNTIATVVEPQECLYCDASDDVDCLLHPERVTTSRMCVEGCVASFYERKSNPLVKDFVRTCFEDIEPDDRDACIAENNCIRCTDANKCNDAVLPEEEERLSCNHCSGNSCNFPVPRVCLGYVPGDQCYMYFNSTTNSVVSMGCRSDLQEQQITAEIKQFYLCDTDNCNDYSNLEDANVCVICDSATNENCAVDATKVTARVRCQSYPYTDCAMSVTAEGTTVRGCHKDVPDEQFLNCTRSDDNKSCQRCIGEACNRAVFPVDRQQCHRCNSKDDADCEAAPNSPQACPVYAAEDGCITALSSDSLTRGCASELFCDLTDTKTCQRCDGNNCNTVNLADLSIGDPGMFQGLPLNCHHCTDKETCANGGLLERCWNSTTQTCVTAFDDNGDVIHRGCSDLTRETCSKSGNQCYECKSNGCNVANSESDYIDCLFCDARNYDACTFESDSITRRRKCYKSCMTALFARTNDSEPVYELIRTCLDDKDLDDRELCESGADSSCKACSTSQCNTDIVGERKSCLQCTGQNCNEPQQAPCRAFLEQDGCFVEFSETEDIVRHGCKSDYDPPDTQLLLSEKRLWLCDADNCNAVENVPTAQSCALCSSRSDERCAISPGNVTSRTTCENIPYTQCYSRVLDDGHTERGCISSIDGVDFLDCLNNVNSTKCTYCSGNNCNSQLFPEDRRSCHICTSEYNNNACETSPSSSKVCSKFNIAEKCVTLIDDSGFTVRGCSSEVSCNAADTTNCHICDGDDCNVANLKRKSDANPGFWNELPISCWHCTSEEECASNTAAAVCIGEDYCMTVFNEDGAVVQRGCSSDVEQVQSRYCDDNSQNCYNCNSNNCNSAVSQDDYVDCVYCDSQKDANCVQNPEAIQARRKCNKNCMTALYARTVNGSVFDMRRDCLDDRNPNQQVACLEGSNDCVACNENAACNKESVPANRLSCYSCEGEECQDPQAKLCVAHVSNDQCFMLFDEISDVVRLGCRSDLTDAFVTDNDQLLLCSDGDNCNDLLNVPTPTICASCNSLNDEQCASNPSNVPDVTRCTTLPNTQCATRVTNAGATERLCVSSLTKAQRLSCLSGNATDCTLCTNDRCNIEVFPANRRRCHRCNTETDPSCENAPNAATVCPHYSTSEFCTVKLVGEHTYRGCSYDFICDDTDKQYCRLCSGTDNCNTIDLISANIGYPGKWQELPISCHHCTDSECDSEATTVLQQCSNNNLQNCVTVFGVNGNVVQRGCSDEIYEGKYATHCDTNSENCKFCKSNGCNNANALSDFVNCVFCDGSDNVNCVLNVDAITRTRSCHQQCFTALYPRSNETNPAYELARGCLDDLDLDDRSACQNGEKAYCQPCTDAACNTVSIPAQRQKCIHCEGTDCANNAISLECTAFREHEQCYAQYDDEGILLRKGCASALNGNVLQQNRRYLHLCDADDCNLETPALVACTICNSSADPNCVFNPALVAAAACDKLPHSICYTRVDANGITHRGCLADELDDNAFDDCLSGDSSTCAICSENGCNTADYPSNRRKCNRCNSNVDPTCEDNPSQFSSVCLIYNEEDSCVTKIEGSTTMRACASDFTCDTSNRDSCRICAADNCNTINLLAGYVGEPGKWQDLPLNCYACEGENCANGVTGAHKCENNNLQNCLSVFDETGTLIKRGCSDEVAETHGEYCDEHSDRCIACKSNGCNTATALSDYVDCYFCDSSDSNSCSVNFATTTRTRKCLGGCMVALYARSSANDTAYELSRSCLDDFDEDDRDLCAGNNWEHCIACTDARCNSDALPAVRHQCHKCIDSECAETVTQECNAYHPNDQCYILFNDVSSIVNMGCRSEFEGPVVTELIRQKRLTLCDGNNCNSYDTVPNPNTCSVCNSELDTQCATNPNLVANYSSCRALPYTECFTRINSDGHTERGCASTLENDNFYDCITGADNLCETCHGEKCNEIDVFPAGRLSCHQCSAADNELCNSAPNSNQVCPIYSATDSCITNLRNGVTVRGCASSMKCDNANDKRNCRSCTTSGCNTVDLLTVSESGEPGRWSDVPLTCHVCKGAEECASGAIYRVCESNLYQNCMTVFDAEGKVVQRGCSDTVETDNEALCNANADRCLRCNSNGCNSITDLAELVECVSCDTDLNGNCVSDVGGITRTRQCHKNCMTALYKLYEEDNPSYGLARTCLNDMDIDEQEACLSGSSEYCRACSDAKCNTADIPETRLSCYKCDGENCQDPQPTICSTFRATNEQCYISYDEKRSINAMGCRSEFSHVDTNNLLREKRLFFCNGDNCNTFDAQPVAQRCTLCSSRSDINCATNPHLVNSSTNCNDVPYTGCYARALPSGITERGCVFNLQDDEFLSCWNGTANYCESCDGDYCNNNVYPAGRTSCHICNSETNLNCEANPQSLSICPSFMENDRCVTSYLNGVTYRGCSSTLTCDVTDSRICNICSGDGCNVINLSGDFDDNYGKWQDLPLRCLSCSGEDCLDASNNSTQICQNNNQQDCITVFDISGVVVRRGCADEVYSEHGDYCGENSDRCFNCKSNECNTAESVDEFVQCVYCDSHRSLGCVWNANDSSLKTRKCQGSCMTALYPSDASDNPSYDLIRSCLNDKELINQTACAAGNDAYCSACTDASCNVKDLPEQRLRCHICDGDSCEEPETKLCPLYKPNDQCYAWFDASNSVIQMGCASSFRNQDLQTLLRTKKVYLCNGEDCNALTNLPSAQSCAVCESTDDVSCAVRPDQIGTVESCNQLPWSHCYSRIIGSETLRGCVYDLPTDEFVDCVSGNDELCGICTGNGCNRAIYPEDRQQCYHCNSEDDSFCESNPSRLYPCALYGDNVSCRTAVGGNNTQRACSTDLICDISDRNTCRNCFATGCNAIDLINKKDDGYHGIWQELPLKCHTCVGEHCQHSLGPSEICEGNDMQDCMTVFDQSGNVTRRGCSDLVEDYADLYCRQNPNHCFKCKSNECNYAWSLSDYRSCRFCDSSNSSICVTYPESADILSRDCYKECMVALQDKQLTRSCLDDKELFDQQACRSGGDGTCQSCGEYDCNNFNYPADRLRCHVCSGSTCSDSIAEYCLLYDQNDFCFAKYEGNGVDLLGCASSQNSSDLEEWRLEKILYECSENECNQLSRLPGAGVCVSCDSSKTPECAQNPTAVNVTASCAAPNSACFTRIIPGGHTIRDCLSTISEIEQNSCTAANNCQICAGDSNERCNNQVFPSNRLSCHICNSVADANCASAPNVPQICLLYADNDRCVSKKTDDFIERGCGTSILCNDEDCQFCAENNCNDADLTDSAALISSSLMLTILLTFLFHIFLK